MIGLKAARQRVADLRVELATISKQLHAVGSAAIAGKRPLTDGERAEIDRLTARKAALLDEQGEADRDLAAAEARNEAERNAEPIVDPDREAGRMASARAGLLTGSAPPTTFTTTAPRGRRFADLFPRTPLTTAGFGGAEDFLASLASGRHDPRLSFAPSTQATSTISNDPSGGFAVPSQIFASWFDAALEDQIVLPRCDIRPMMSSTAKAVAWDDGDHSAGLYGGFTGGWAPEGEDIALETAKLQLMTLHANKLAILCRVSNELISDGVGFEQQLGAAIAKAIAWFLDRAFLHGRGSGEPLGVLNAPAAIEIAPESGQSADTIVFANIVKMFARLHPASVKTAIWIASSSTLPELLTLAMPIGTAGDRVAVLDESNGTYRLLGREVVFTEKAAKLGDRGDLALVDLSQYTVGIRSDFQLAKSVDLGFASDTSHFRGLMRVDGQPKIAKAITPADGGPTQSPFVVLGERA